jgi:hypothetical protein
MEKILKAKKKRHRAPGRQHTLSLFGTTLKADSGAAL